MASPREVVVGWFPTGNVNQTPAVFHNMYFTKKSEFTATAVLSKTTTPSRGQLAHARILLDEGIYEQVHDHREAAGAVPRGAPHFGNKQE